MLLMTLIQSQKAHWMPADFEVFVQCSVTPLHMSERAAAPQIVRRFQLIKKTSTLFLFTFFVFIYSARLSYGITRCWVLYLLWKKITQMRSTTKIVYKFFLGKFLFTLIKVQAAALDTSDYEYSCAPNDGRSCWRESNVQLFPGELQMRRPALRSSAQLRL